MLIHLPSQVAQQQRKRREHYRRDNPFNRTYCFTSNGLSPVWDSLSLNSKSQHVKRYFCIHKLFVTLHNSHIV